MFYNALQSNCSYQDAIVFIVKLFLFELHIYECSIYKMYFPSIIYDIFMLLYAYIQRGSVLRLSLFYMSCDSIQSYFNIITVIVHLLNSYILLEDGRG